MYELLEKINSPADLKALPIKDLERLCRELRDYIITCCAENPGHLASSLGAVEIIVGFHYVFDSPSDKIVFDVGHQAYAHKILTGRREQFRDNRKEGGPAGFPSRAESVYDAFGAGHSSTSVSAALGLAEAVADIRQRAARHRYAGHQQRRAVAVLALREEHRRQLGSKRHEAVVGTAAGRQQRAAGVGQRIP